MSGSGNRIETVRIQTSLGVLIVVSHSGGVRAGQIFEKEMPGGAVEYDAQCVDWYSRGIPAIQSRVPSEGGCSSVDDLERMIVEEVDRPMRTDYWSDR